MHKIISPRAVESRKRKAEAEDANTKQVALRRQLGDQLFFELHYAMMTIHCNLPFNVSESSTSRDLFTAVTGFPISMCAETVQRAIFTIYDLSTTMVKSRIAAAKNSTVLPLFHLLVDLWTCKVSSSKYLGAHLFFMDAGGKMQSLLLSCQLYLRSRQGGGADDLLPWVEDALREFGLAPHDILSMTTDGGSDVRRLGESLMGCNWQWCIAHLLSLCMNDAFNPPPEALQVAKDYNEYLNRSDPARQAVEVQQLQQDFEPLSPHNDVPQRWLSSARMLERLLTIYEPAKVAFSTTVPRPQRFSSPHFPLDEHRETLVQLYSLQKLVADVIRTSQNSTQPMGAEMIVSLSSLLRALQEDQPLPLFDPTVRRSSNAPPLEPVERPAHLLTPATRSARATILNGINTRFLKQYRDKPTVVRMYELAAYFYPPLVNMQHLETAYLFSSTLAKTIRDSAKTKIAELCRKVACASHNIAEPVRAPTQTTAAGFHPATVQQIPVFGPRPPTHFLFAGRAQDAPTPHSQVKELIETEMTSYESHARTITHAALHPMEVMHFWEKHAALYPNLAKVARSVYGFQVSSAAIERDFSVSGNLVTSRRSQMNSAYVHMMLFLKINNVHLDSLDLSRVSRLLTQREVDSKWPFAYPRIRLRHALLLGDEVAAEAAAARRRQLMVTALEDEAADAAENSLRQALSDFVN